MSHKTVTATHVEGMRFDIVTGSGHVVITDDGQGDQAPRPIELVAAALASCTAMDVISILRKKRQVVTGYRVRVDAEQRDDHPQVFTRLDVVHEVTGPDLDVEAVRRSIELSATRYCPINAMLASGATEIHHGYVVRVGDDERAADVVTTGPFRWPTT